MNNTFKWGYLRPSETDRFEGCPSSILPPPDNIIPRVESDIARSGTAGHECQAIHVADLAPDIEHIAKTYNTDIIDLMEMHANGVRAWSALKKKYEQLWRNAEPERAVTGKLVRGTADVFSYSQPTMKSPKQLIIIDWKFGHSREHHPNQLKSYGLAGVQELNMPPETRVILIEAWVRHGEFHEVA